MHRPQREPATMIAALALAIGTAGCSVEGEQGSAQTGNPLAGQAFYVDPGGAAAVQADRWRRQGRVRQAAAMEWLAARPTATWFADEHAVESRVRSLTQRAVRANRTPLLVAYYLPGRDCGSYSAGGAPTSAEYRSWIRAFARGIGDRRAVVVVEPDAVAQAVDGCLSTAGRRERESLLRFAVRTLSERPRAHVYLDAGNAGWVRPPSRMARPLRRAGIGAADGFALNVSSFYDTPRTVRYGKALSRRLGGAHFIVDTSRNGNGAQRADDRHGPKWCNPPGRAVGRDPVTTTRPGLVDAYVWVKEPGVSDGACRPGAPQAGRWWPDYALGLIENRR